MAKRISHNVSSYIQSNNLCCSGIHVANTQRAIMTGRFLEIELGTTMTLHDEFKPIKNTEKLVGLTEYEVKILDPIFTNELMLSRAGILNAYHHSSNLTGAMVRRHEEIAYNKFKNIVSNVPNGVILFIMHHSTLTDIVINLARKYYEYPSIFYGNIECELGHIFLFDFDKGIFELANVDSDELLINSF